MPFEQALAPDELTAIQILPVPDLWPPAVAQPRADGRPAAGLPGLPSARLGDPGDQVWPRQFAVLLIEALTGDRPARQVLPWLSERGRSQLRRLRPLFGDGQRARIHRVMTTLPSPDVVEMTLIVAIGPRIRALAVRLTLAPTPATAASARWVCTDIEAA
jgi:Family of unknown function (DUF6459)